MTGQDVRQLDYPLFLSGMGIFFVFIIRIFEVFSGLLAPSCLGPQKTWCQSFHPGLQLLSFGCCCHHHTTMSLTQYLCSYLCFSFACSRGWMSSNVGYIIRLIHVPSQRCRHTSSSWVLKEREKQILL